MSDTRCQFATHCNGEGRIQLHVVAHDVLCCVKCAAGEEGLTQKEVRTHLAEGRLGIHRARSTGHKC